MNKRGKDFNELEHLPPVKVIIADAQDAEDVVIKVSDEGGGIKRSHLARVLTYLFSTVKRKISKEDLQQLHDFGISSPIAGLGYGLPVAQTYVRYFGGDLTIVPIEGYGTDAFVHLSRVDDRKEPLP